MFSLHHNTSSKIICRRILLNFTWLFVQCWHKQLVKQKSRSPYTNSIVREWCNRFYNSWHIYAYIYIYKSVLRELIAFSMNSFSGTFFFHYFHFSQKDIFIKIMPTEKKFKNLECLHSTFRTFVCCQAFKQAWDSENFNL